MSLVQQAQWANGICNKIRPRVQVNKLGSQSVHHRLCSGFVRCNIVGVEVFLLQWAVARLHSYGYSSDQATAEGFPLLVQHRPLDDEHPNPIRWCCAMHRASDQFCKIPSKDTDKREEIKICICRLLKKKIKKNLES